MWLALRAWHIWAPGGVGFSFFSVILSFQSSKPCQWTWAAAASGVVETAGLVSMAVHQLLIHVAQAPPHGPLLTFLRPSRGLANQRWWTRLALQWWLSPSRKPNRSPADITCTPPVSVTAICRTVTVHFHISSFVFLKLLWCSSPHSLPHRRPSSTLTAPSALVCLSSFSWESPAYISAPSTGRVCHSPHGDLSSIPAIAPFWPHHDPCTSASAVYPPPLWFRCCSGAALAHGAPGPAASYTCTGGLSAEAPSTWDAAEDGGSEAQVDAASNVSIPIVWSFFFTPSFKT